MIASLVVTGGQVPQPSIVEGYRHHRVDFVFSFFNTDPYLDGPEVRSRFFSVPPTIPGDFSSASSARESHVVGNGRVGNRGHLSASGGGALSAPSRSTVDAVSVKEEFVVRSFVARSSAVRSSVVSRPVSYRVLKIGPPIEIRLVGRQWVKPGLISHEWSAWCKPNVRSQVALSQSSPVEVELSSVGHAPEDVAMDGGDRVLYLGVGDLRHQFDDILFRSYVCFGNGRQFFPSCSPLYDKFAGVVPASGLSGVINPIRLRNVRVGRPAIAQRLHAGEVARSEGRTFIHNLEGRKSNAWCSTMRVRSAHHEGRGYYAPSCTYSLPFPRHARIVYIDTCKIRWCSVDSAAPHSFVWPRNVKELNGIARTLFTSHCDSVDVLIVRDRCFSSNQVCFCGLGCGGHMLFIMEVMRALVMATVYRLGSYMGVSIGFFGSVTW